MIIDTHLHICDSVFDNDRDDVLARGRDEGVNLLLAVSETLADCERNLELAEKYAELRVAAGLYPAHADFQQAGEVVGFIRRHHGKLTAIGEVGLDFRPDQPEGVRQVQVQVFGLFIDLALELDLPLNVHCRSAGRQAVAVLLEKGVKKVQMHAFDGKYSNALPAVEAGFFFSVPPSVIRSPQKQKLVKHLPLSCLLVESDSPVLGPEVGVRNEPANITLAIKAIAALKNASVEEVAETLFNNSRMLYGFGITG